MFRQVISSYKQKCGAKNISGQTINQHGNSTSVIFAAFLKSYKAQNSRLVKIYQSSICPLFVSNGINRMVAIFAEQCTCVFAQRVRRTIQIAQLYERIYSQQAKNRIMEKLRNGLNLQKKSKPLYFLFSAVMFSWDREYISDEELNRLMEDMELLQLKEDLSKEDEDKPQKDVKEVASCGPAPKESSSNSTKSVPEPNWELLINRKDFKVWRKSVPDSYLYQYKVYGAYHDIPARAFYNVQVDLDYRRKWDKLIEHLSVIDRDEKSGCEVVHWISHFPYPMYSREYVYVRRAKVDSQHNMMILINKATLHPKCPMQDKYVRVETYDTQMVIHPHSTFDENGFDYVLTYFDDPKAAFPSFAYNWMAKTGVPDFVDKVHDAAKELHQRKRPSVPTSRANNDYEGQPNLNRL